jgi:FG-GAP-like repeat
MAYFRTRSLVFLLIVFSSILFACAPNAGKDGSSGSDGADYVPPEGSTAPQAPSSLTATATGSSQIDLTWSFNSGSETGFNVQRMVAGDDWETIGGTTANVTIYQDTTVECEKTYSYRALAYNDFGESSPSSEASATADYCEIDAPTDLTALLDDAEESGQQRAIILSWSQGPGELPGVVTSYEIYRKTYEGIWSDTPLETQPAETTTYTDDTATCGSRFQYRTRAVNDHGEEGVKSAFSNTATTESDVCPLLEPTNLVATDDQAGIVTLTWDINDPDATGYLLQRSEVEARADWVTIADLPEGTTSFDDEDLECETLEYDYRIQAYNRETMSAWVETLESGKAFCVVEAPGGLYGEVLGPEEIRLSWVNNADNQTGFYLYRDEQLIATLSFDERFHSDTDVTCETTYRYQAKAFNDNVASHFSDTAIVLSGYCPVDDPTGLTATTNSIGQIIVAWTDNSNDEYGFVLQRRLEGEVEWQGVESLSPDTQSYADVGVTCGAVNYEYRVRAFDSNTISEWSNIDTGSALCPVAAPDGLNAVELDDETIRLNWADNADNESGYKVYRNTILVDELDADTTHYFDNDLDCETSYSYYVIAFNVITGVDSDPSNGASATTSWCPVDAPTTLSATTDGVGAVTLTWTDNSNEEQGYHIQRAIKDSGEWRHLNAIPADATNYEDDSATCESVEYDYRIQAFDEYTTSDWSNTATGSSLCPVEKPTGLFAQLQGPLEIELTWYNNADNQTGFRIYRDGSPIGVVDSDITVYSDVSVTCDTVYRYFVTAFSSSVESEDSLVVGTQTLYCPVNAPTNLVATGADQDRVDLTWEDNADNETNFDILRRELGETAWQTIATEAANTELYSDTTVECLHIYEYIVLAYNDDMSSSPTDLATGRPTGCTPIRPRPVVDTLAPSSHLAMLDYEYCDGAESLGDHCRNNDPEDRTEDSTCDCGGLCWWDYTDCGTPSKTLYQLRINGSGIAADTQALIGDLSLSCSSNASECQADDEGNPDPEHGVCATSCVVNLPVLIMKNADTYMVRLSTPDPVFDSLNISEDTLVFSVVAPLPEITRIWPTGLMQILSDSGSPMSQDFTVQVWGRDMMDNVQFRLGSNYGEITVDGIDTDSETGEQFVEVDVSTADLFPRDDPYFFTAINPSPGGGERSKDFGINPRVDRWEDQYLTDMRPTRSPLSSNLRWHRIDASTRSYGAGVQWSGENNWAALRNSSGDLLYRISRAVATGAIPFPVGAAWLDIQDDSGRAPNAYINYSNDISYGGTGAFPSNPNDTDYFNGGSISYVAISDLDGDGNSDVVTANNQNEMLSVRLGTGYGTLAAKTDYFLGGLPYIVALEDLDGDHVPDIIAANGVGLSTRLGNGDGTFGLRSDLPEGGESEFVVADLNGDGVIDILAPVLNVGITFWEGRGDGSFNERVTVNDVDTLTYSHLADFDGDGLLDLVGLDWGDSNKVKVFAGIGEGDFVETGAYTLSNAHSINVAEANGDGATDILVVRDIYTDGNVAILPNNGDGTFNTASDVAMGAYQFATMGDLNSDGIPDMVAAADIFDPEVTFRLGNLDGSFGVESTIDFIDPPSHLIIHDMDGDGAPDFVIGNGDNVSIRLGQAGSTFGARTDMPFGTSPSDIVVGDFNNDGEKDIAVASMLNSQLSYSINTGGRNFAVRTELYTTNQPSCLTACDLNKDGSDDLIAGFSNHGAANSVCVFLSNGNGTFGAESTFAAGSDVVDIACADVNNNGNPDIITINGVSDDVSVLPGNGAGSLGAAQSFGVGPWPTGLVLGDLDKDGNKDIVATDYSNNGIFTLAGNGDGTFDTGVLFSMGNGPNSVAIGDINGDTNPDVVVVNVYPTTFITARLGDGAGGFGDPASYFMYDEDSQETGISLADLNGDSAPDVIICSEVSDIVVVRLGNGDGTFSDPGIFDTDNNPRRLAVADLDGDSAADILTANRGGSSVTLRFRPVTRSWRQELTDSFSEYSAKPWLTKSAPLGITTDLSVHQGYQNLTRIAVRVLLEWTGATTGSVDLTLTAPDGTSVDLGTIFSINAWPTLAAVEAYRLNETFRENDVALLAALHGIQPSGEWTLSIENNTDGDAQVKRFTIITDGEF